MEQLILISDDLTGAADSGGYFVNKGLDLEIYTGENVESLYKLGEKNIAINLSTRNSTPDEAFKKHYNVFKNVYPKDNRIIMKKIGTGFRGLDQYEINGMLKSNKDLLCFIVDSAPDLGTFTLYGNQYCEGCILTKSLYAKDPIIAPKKSYIPDILKDGLDYEAKCINIDLVKGDKDNLIKETAKIIDGGYRVIVFDAITAYDANKIVNTFNSIYKNIVWTGSLGIASALSEYIFRKEESSFFNDYGYSPNDRCVCFSASAYEATKKQISYSSSFGLQKIEIDIDKIIDGEEKETIEKSVEEYKEKIKKENVILIPKVNKYSHKDKVSSKILEVMARCASEICSTSYFDRLVIIGGETAQVILKALDINVISLKESPDTGSAIGEIALGKYKGRKIALKGGSIGSLEAIEFMTGRMKREHANNIKR